MMPAAALAILLAILFTDSRIHDAELELRERGQSIAALLGPAAENALLNRDHQSLLALVDSISKRADITLVAIADTEGELLAASGDTTLLKLQNNPKNHNGPGVTVVDHDDMLVFSAPIYQSESVPEYRTSPPINNGKRNPARISIVGWVNVMVTKAHILQRRDQILYGGFIVSLLVLIGAALLAIRAGKLITRAIDRLLGVVREIEHGNLDVQTDTHAGGEIGVLATKIGGMAAALKSAQETMREKVDAATKQLSYQASHDMLTGLINRHEFEIRLEHAVSSAQEHGATHALCFLDLDQFKTVNDSCGHEAGDQLLRQLGHHLKNKIRDRDTLARLGGDEFAFLLSNCCVENAIEVARELLASIQGFRFSWQGKSFVVGCSIGLVPINRRSENVATVLSNADAACYAAKDLGGNRIYVFQVPEDGIGVRPAGTSWVTRINQALENNRFRLVYQPIVPLGNNQSRYYEALLRMVQDNGDEVLPLAFIPAAERYNLMPAIDRWVIERAFADYRRLMDAGLTRGDCMFSINLSGASICDEKLPKFLEYQFSTYQVPPQRICFEITETAAVTNLTQALSVLQQQKRIGCRFMLDDFGSGLSSFTYLKNLPVDGIKIDGAFVKDMVNNGMDAAMVEAINNIGHVMGLSTVAEYVEDQAIMQKLGELKVDYAQGHWVRAPAPLEECFNLGHKERIGFHV